MIRRLPLVSIPRVRSTSATRQLETAHAGALVKALIPITIVIAVCITRLLPILTAGFPLGDGGLFAMMVGTLQHAHYHLPLAMTYNGRRLPFAYPPLGFYATAWLVDRTGIPLLTIMRLFPLTVSLLTVGAVGLLARAVLPSRTQVWAAIFAFGMLPLSYRYFIMGAGVTRAPGLLFAVLTIWQAYLLYTRRQWRFVGPTALFAALTILSHPNATWFAAESVTLLFLVFGRRPSGLLHSAVVAGSALALAAPWWVLVISRDGITPFLSASQSGSPGAPSWLLLLELRFSAEPLYPVLLTGGLLGVLCSVRDRRYWLPLWLVVSCALDTRYSGTFATVPLALLVGIGAERVLDLSRRIAQAPSPRSVNRGVSALLCGAALYAFVSATALPGPDLQALPLTQRAAMHWVTTHTRRGSSFLIVAPAGDSAGSESEWFPALTSGRISLAAYQGTEWLKRAKGSSPWQRYNALQACGTSGTTCLERWARQSGVRFRYVYVRTEGTISLQEDLLHSSRYALKYRNGGTLIFAHHDGTGGGSGAV